MTTNTVTSPNQYKVNYWTIDWDETDHVEGKEFETFEETKDFIQQLISTKHRIDGIYDTTGRVLTRKFFGL